MTYAADLWTAWMERERARVRRHELSREVAAASRTSDDGAGAGTERERALEHARLLAEDAEARFEALWSQHTARTEARLRRHVDKLERSLLPRGVRSADDPRLGEIRPGGRRWAILRFRAHGIEGAPN